MTSQFAMWIWIWTALPQESSHLGPGSRQRFGEVSEPLRFRVQGISEEIGAQTCMGEREREGKSEEGSSRDRCRERGRRNRKIGHERGREEEGEGGWVGGLENGREGLARAATRALLNHPSHSIRALART